MLLNFTVFLLLLISSFMPLWSEEILAMLSVFLICFVAWHLVYLRKCSMCAWEQCVFRCCWIQCSICLLGPFGLQYCSSLLFLYCLCLDNLSIVESGLLKSPTISVLLFISPLSCVIFLLYIFRYSNVWCLDIYNCYIFCMDWLLYHYTMTLFVFVYYF